MEFEAYFTKNKSEIEKNKFIIILGSGFHKQASIIEKNRADIDSVLTSWPYLLKQLGASGKYNSSILEFEQLLKEKTKLQNELAAHKVETQILEAAAKLILEEQEKIKQNKGYQHLCKLFNPKYVSDVISLNFDFTAELVCNGTTIDEYPNKIKDLSTFYHKSNKIRFWYPHGHISSPETIILSLRNYGMSIQKAELMRKHYKANEKKKNINKPYPNTWFSYLMDRPVLILGSDISTNEWDLWFTLMNRERNYSKKDTQQYKAPVFKMRDETIKKYLPADPDILYQKIKSNSTFTEQWNLLIKLFN